MTVSSPFHASPEVPHLGVDPGSGANPMHGLAMWAAVFWVIWMAILPLGHVTALRNALALPVILLALLVAFRHAGWQSLAHVPAIAPWLLLISWCLLSLVWSGAPQVSWSKIRSDLLLPFGAYLSAYVLARHTGAKRYLVLGPAIGLTLLALLSLFAWIDLPDWISGYTQPGTFRAMPIWYPEVADASAFPVLLIGPLLAWALLARHHRSWLMRWAPVGAGLVLLLSILATNRRNSLVCAALMPPIFLVLLGSDGKRLTKRALAWAGLAALAVVVALAVFLEYGARERMSPAENAALAPNHSAALQLIKAEPRPRIWAYYLEKAREHPWIGVGFGRTVPAIFYGTKNDPALAAIDTNAQIHAHNFLLDWLLQTGLFGLILLCTLLVAVGRHAWQLGQEGRQHRIIACAVLVSIIGMLLRNLTDDFMVYANATMFWATQGALLGLLAYAPMTRRPTGN